jgi:hypothetical protein
MIKIDQKTRPGRREAGTMPGLSFHKMECLPVALLQHREKH